MQLSEIVLAQGGRMCVSNAGADGLRLQVRERVRGARRQEVVCAEAFTGHDGTLNDAAAACAAQLPRAV